MPISFNKYIRIVSSVGGVSTLSNRQLIGRLFTTNELVPTRSFTEFTSANEVGAYFGTTSEEYLRALFYFSWISKSGNSAPLISFARWVDVDVAAEIFGFPITTSLSTFQGISNGAFNLTIDTTTHLISGLNFTATVSLAGVAGVIQAGINAETGLDWTAATVAYDSLRGSFDFASGVVGGNVAVSTAAPGSGTNLLPLIGWGTDAIFSNSADAETVTETLIASDEMSTNFGSFLFMPALTLDQITEAARWNDAQNVKYMYDVPVALADAATYSAALDGLSGVQLTLAGTSGEYHEMVPMLIEAATDYSQVDVVQNYMFQVFNLTPTVTDTSTSNLLDSLRVNYYGQTQSAGQLIELYQRGFLMGVPSVNPVDMSPYADEQWLKSAIGTQIMNMFLAFTQIPANVTGSGLVTTNLTSSVIALALSNGVISVGKTLDITQIQFITRVTRNSKAWYQVQNQGYYLNVAIISKVLDNGVTQYNVSYLLVYGKNDTIRQAEGRDILI